MTIKKNPLHLYCTKGDHFGSLSFYSIYLVIELMYYLENRAKLLLKDNIKGYQEVRRIISCYLLLII